MTTTQTQKETSQQEIERRAYSLYEERGATPGHELDDWLAAEKEVGGADSSAPPRLPVGAEKQTQTGSTKEAKPSAPTDADEQASPT